MATEDDGATRNPTTSGRAQPPLRSEVRASLEGIEDEWDALVDAAPLPSPFLRSWWLQSVAGPRPRFVLLFDGDALAGGLALEEDQILGLPRLRTIGHSIGADHLDAVAAPRLVDEVIRGLRGWFAQPGSRLIDLVGLGADARVGAALPGRVRRELIDVAPWSQLPRSLEEYIAQRPHELKNLVNRPLRRLTRDGVHHQVAGIDSCEATLEALRDLHAAHWGERSEFLPAYEHFARAARDGIRTGELVLHELVFQGQIIAVTVFFEVAGRASFYQAGRDDDRRWRGSGTALMALAVGHACDQGCRELDLLRGDDPYKRIWGSNSRDVVRLRAGRGVQARAALAVLPIRAALRRVGRRAAERFRSSRRADARRSGRRPVEGS